MQIRTAHQSKNLRVGLASAPPSRSLPTGLMARTRAIRNSRATIHCQTPPRASLITALPFSVKCLASARSTAETSRKISRGIAPTQRGGCRHQERWLEGISDISWRGRGQALTASRWWLQQDRSTAGFSPAASRARESPIRGANLKAWPDPPANRLSFGLRRSSTKLTSLAIE